MLVYRDCTFWGHLCIWRHCVSIDWPSIHTQSTSQLTFGQESRNFGRQSIKCPLIYQLVNTQTVNYQQTVHWVSIECWSRCQWSVTWGSIKSINWHSTTDAFITQCSSIEGYPISILPSALRVCCTFFYIWLKKGTAQVNKYYCVAFI